MIKPGIYVPQNGFNYKIEVYYKDGKIWYNDISANINDIQCVPSTLTTILLDWKPLNNKCCTL